MEFPSCNHFHWLKNINLTKKKSISWIFFYSWPLWTLQTNNVQNLQCKFTKKTWIYCGHRHSQLIVNKFKLITIRKMQPRIQFYWILEKKGCVQTNELLGFLCCVRSYNRWIKATTATASAKVVVKVRKRLCQPVISQPEILWSLNCKHLNEDYFWHLSHCSMFRFPPR